MRIFDLARNLPQALRATLAVLLLIFAANCVADAGHDHQRATTTAHLSVCGYCAAFANIVDAPTHAIATARISVVLLLVSQRDEGRFARSSLTAAQPRAPPLC